MQTWIALFRGINVGGKHLVSMSVLVSELESLKLRNIRTYIQSGNVVFESSSRNAKTLGTKISKCVESKFGFRPAVLVLTESELRDAISNNPFPKATAIPKSLGFYFLDEPSKSPNMAAIDEAKIDSEKYVITDDVFYLYAPDGVGRSKLARNVEKYLGVTATARNYRTVESLIKMLPDE